MSRRSKRKAGRETASLVQPKAPARRQEVKPKASSVNARWVVVMICIFLAAVIWVVYGQTLRYGFVNYDDGGCVYENTAVTSGLMLNGVISAFRHGEVDNWVPLTTISHMLDCQMYGLSAGGHHLTNVLLHTTSAILLFLVLRQMTGAIWRSAFVATIFAVHPLHVESVAWISERKDTLSGLFFMLTLWAYVRYVRQSALLPRYMMALLFFALGLMSKPMLVTLPFALLLLDYWPLKRFSNAESVYWLKNFPVPTRLILEKIPLFLLSIASCILTVLAQNQGHAIQSLDKLHFSTRIGNALVSCATYVWQTFYPVGLAPYYPYSEHGLPFWKIIAAFMVLVAISLGAFHWRRKCPYLLVGWLWYLGTLVPVIGLIQVGGQALADRYTYLPQIGLSFMLVWFAADVSAGWWNRRLLLNSMASVSIIILMVSARLQASYWKDSETLWTHTLAVTSNNSFAHNNLGVALNQNKQLNEAIIQFRQALAINPNNVQAHYNLGAALAQKGQVDAAIVEYKKALAINPDDADTYNNLGYALAQKGQVDAAIIQFQKALAVNPNDARAHNNLGGALGQKGQVDEAIVQFQKALAINPNDARADNELAGALAQKGQVDEAIVEYKKALVLQPGFVSAQNNLTQIAWVLATSPDPSLRNGPKAVELARQTDRLTHGDNPRMAATLAAADAETGDFTEAIAGVRRALQLASSQNNAAVIPLLQAQLKCYQAGTPFRDAGTTP